MMMMMMMMMATREQRDECMHVYVYVHVYERRTACLNTPYMGVHRCDECSIYVHLSSLFPSFFVFYLKTNLLTYLKKIWAY